MRLLFSSFFLSETAPIRKKKNPENVIIIILSDIKKGERQSKHLKKNDISCLEMVEQITDRILVLIKNTFFKNFRSLSRYLPSLFSFMK